MATAVGLAGASVVSVQVSDTAMQSFEESYQPLVDLLHSSPAFLCEALDTYVDGRGLEGRERPRSFASGDDGRFVLTFRGGSADPDGSTIYYDSESRKWSLFHNDDPEGSRKLQDLMRGMQSCPAEA